MQTKFACFFGYMSLASGAGQFALPELYQDVFIAGKIVHQGVRSCQDRYEAILPIIKKLPARFKMLDIGASQGYFSFRIATDFCARPTMIEDSYTTTDFVWQTGDYLKYLCKQNAHLKNITLLQQRFFSQDLRRLGHCEQFDLVLAFSVIHHMKKNELEPHAAYVETVDAILCLAPVVLIENPINTGEHTLFIRKVLQERGGKVVYTSLRGTLVYEIYLFDQAPVVARTESMLPNITQATYDRFSGAYTTVEGIV